MNWIKKYGDRLYLALVATALLASAIMVLLKADRLPEKFSDVTTAVPVNEATLTDPPFEPSAVELAKIDLNKPPGWMTAEEYKAGVRGSLFVSQSYIIGPDGFPIKVVDSFVHQDIETGKMIPSRWFMEHNLPPLEANAALRDPDQDGFTNGDEWRNNTDPTNKDSHPPYYTKLFLKQITRVPFHLVFTAFNGDPKRARTWEFQINTIDLNQPSKFLKIGDTVPNTHFKLERFEFKERKNAKIDAMEDVSELTVVNTETEEPVVLMLGKVTDAPDLYALFDYQWPPAAGEIRVKKFQEFGLRPETDQLYRLMDAQETDAVIRLPDGSMHSVVRNPRHTAK